MAERSKAPDLSSGSRKRAWESGWPSGKGARFKLWFSKESVGVRMAERYKAPDLSSGSLKRAWVRTPLLTVVPTLSQDGRASKAPDLSSGSRKRAWVRTPLLTIVPTLQACYSIFDS
ncbi:hypothetical protein TNCV_2974271 [Trichonephila clavipes]|nr:hypothetical protein TNCV_2974271 [Trichonephila clavipes]